MEYARHLLALAQTTSKTSSVALAPRFFLYLLDRELARAERYNHFAGFLLFRLEGTQKVPRASVLVDGMAEILAGNMRKSDCLGSFDESTLGVIVLHAGRESVGVVLERLKMECRLYLSQAPREVSLSTSYAIYPEEVNSLNSLLELAFRRLQS